MKIEDYSNVIVNVKYAHRVNNDLYVDIIGLVLPHFERKDKNISRRFQCVAHEKNLKSGKYLLYLALSDPEQQIVVSTWAEDYKKVLET